MNALLLLMLAAFVLGWRSSAPGSRPRAFALAIITVVIAASFYRLGVIL